MNEHDCADHMSMLPDIPMALALVIFPYMLFIILVKTQSNLYLELVFIATLIFIAAH